jgi:hypothetical protein
VAGFGREALGRGEKGEHVEFVMRALFVAGLLALTGPTLAAEPSRPLWVFNATDQEIVFLYEAPQCCDIWEEDILGQDRTLKPGERILVDLGDFNGECWFTLYAQFEDGVRRSGQPFDACKTTEFRFDMATLR